MQQIFEGSGFVVIQPYEEVAFQKEYQGVAPRRRGLVPGQVPRGGVEPLRRGEAWGSTLQGPRNRRNLPRIGPLAGPAGVKPMLRARRVQEGWDRRRPACFAGRAGTLDGRDPRGPGSRGGARWRKFSPNLVDVANCFASVVAIGEGIRLMGS